MSQTAPHITRSPQTPRTTQTSRTTPTTRIRRVSLLAAAMEAGAVRVAPGVFAASRMPGSGNTVVPPRPAPAADGKWSTLVRDGKAAAVILVAL
ncbi:hypothetical protein ABZ766_24655 [Streptomyces sp. NPDC006670]|uniref:hypothetical protein n=1 Tax=Streptomyces sp. NPDC006670 TaxID=3154476 RepID=UPI0033F685ED